MSDIRGIGAELGDKLISMISEKNATEGKVKVAEGALAASVAHRRRLERDLEASESQVKGLREEREKSTRAVVEMKEVCTLFTDTRDPPKKRGYGYSSCVRFAAPRYVYLAMG